MFDLKDEMKIASSRVEQMKTYVPELKLEAQEFGEDIPELKMYKDCYNFRAKIHRRKTKIAELVELEADGSEILEIEFEIIVLCYRIRKAYKAFMSYFGVVV